MKTIDQIIEDQIQLVSAASGIPAATLRADHCESSYKSKRYFQTVRRLQGRFFSPIRAKRKKRERRQDWKHKYVEQSDSASGWDRT